MIKKSIGALLVIVAVCTYVHASESTLIGWTFDKSSGTQGWSCNGDMTDVQLTTDGLSVTISGSDPIMTGPVFQEPLSIDQFIEIQIKCDTAGEAQLFWATDLSGKYGGFNESQSIRFALRGDSKFHTYRVYPFWHQGPELRRFRFDLPREGHFTLRSIRVVSPVQGAPASDKTSWQFKDGQQGWRIVDTADVAEGRVSLKQQDGQLVLRSSDPKAAIASPLLALDSKDHFYVSFRMATDKGITGEVFAISKQKAGRESIAFRPIADGQMHTYNVDVGSLDNWQGEILLVGIRPSDEPSDVTTRFESISVTTDPAGPVDLRCRYFGPRETLHRTARPTTVSCLLDNLGGMPAENVTLQLRSSSPEVQVLGDSSKTLPSVQYAVPEETTWQLTCKKPGTYPLALTVKLDGKEVLTRVCKLTFTEIPTETVKKAMRSDSYIPKPQPVKSDFEVGAFYFPGWCNVNRWGPIFDYPNRRPAMGWYDEANPECVDWQIKWAVEHGIDFFMVDWYWNHGGRHLEHWINGGFTNAKYRKYLKWCVMWANHNAPGSHSVEDWEKVTQFWIDNYFGMDEYYRIDDKPVVVIWSPWNIRRDVGGLEESTKLYAQSQKMAKAAGYKGIYFVAMFHHASQKEYEQLQKEGYQAATSYHGFELAARKHADRKYFDFQEVVDTSPELWQREQADSGTMDYFPAVDTGWDSRPWHKDRALVVGNRTPAKLEALCQKAKKFGEENKSRVIMLGPWNEWGEGSYIEPYSEYGFGDLDVIRKVFCKPGDYPPNLVPEDIGRGPYEFDLPKEQSAWELNTEEEVRGWNAGGIETTYRDGCLHGKAFGSDPVLSSPPVRINAQQLGSLKVRMRCDKDSGAQFFWATATQATCENNSVHFKVIGDGKFHEYTVNLAAVPGWRGIVTGVRLDPVHTHGPEFDIDYIRLEKSSE